LQVRKKRKLEGKLTIARIKQFGGYLRKIAKNCPENPERIVALARKLPYHMSGDHADCDPEFCEYKRKQQIGNGEEKEYKPKMPYMKLDSKDFDAFLETVMEQVTLTAAKMLAIEETTNHCENTHITVSKLTSGKRLALSRRGTWEARFFMAIRRKLEGPRWSSDLVRRFTSHSFSWQEVHVQRLLRIQKKTKRLQATEKHKARRRELKKKVDAQESKAKKTGYAPGLVPLNDRENLKKKLRRPRAAPTCSRCHRPGHSKASCLFPPRV
jgi:hypothetical protein